jgi:hypothetical protein
MLPNRLIAGWCLGVLAVSAGSATAGSSGSALTNDLSAASLASRTTFRFLPTVRDPAAMTVAQNAPARNDQADLPNSAGVSLQISPGQSVGVGTRMSFRVSARKAGYVILVDIDANGRMAQIFPTPEMIVQSQEAATNLVRPGDDLVIPNSAARKSGFDYVITPPAGEATLVAIFSDRRVQIIDLPDDAQKPRSEAETIGYLTKWTRELRVPDSRTGKLQPSTWSFDIKRYSIRE